MMVNYEATKYHHSVSEESIIENDEKSCLRLKKDIEDRIIAYNLSQKYKTLDLDKSVLTYSHRKVGWSNPIRRVDENFTFQAKTNFGYGSPSYFFTVLTYKNINVVPFCEVILYRNAKVAEILSYSSKHNLTNDSWVEAIDYICTASNIYLKDESEFVKIYIVDEIKRLTTTLSNVVYDKIDGIEVVKSGYIFLNRDKEYIDLKKYSHDIIEFKGDRVSESLDFVPILEQMSMYNDFSNEIDCIECLSIEILEQMNIRLPEINEHLTTLREEMKIAEIAYSKAVSEKEEYKEQVQIEFNKYNMTQTAKIDYLSYERVYAKLNEPFRLAYNKVVHTAGPFRELSNEVRRFEIIVDNLNRYILKIGNYFKNRNKNE
jgi:hypothetical protein